MKPWLPILLLVAPMSALAAPAAPAPRPVVAHALWAGDPTELPPQELARQLQGVGLPLLPGGARGAAGQALASARRAFAEMRCAEALPPLEKAEERLLSEVAVDDARPLLGEVEALLLACADRVGDGARASRAAARLLMTGGAVPPDVALTLRRYLAGLPFGPPPPPTQVETDPPGAQVIRDLLKVGAAPIAVPGGDPAVDMLDVELGGFRKVHKPLGSGERLSIGLRGEDRLGVLADAVAAKPLGSDPQAEALMGLLAPFRAGALQSGRVLIFAPRQRGGAAAPGERLQARVFDLGARRWLGPISEVGAGAPAQQAQGLLAVANLKVAPVVVQAPRAPQKVAPRNTGGFRLPFTRAKWYSWVIAGGVVALIAGLLIAERVGSDQVVVEATR
jgi:hypothetical protein